MRREYKQVLVVLLIIGLAIAFLYWLRKRKPPETPPQPPPGIVGLPEMKEKPKPLEIVYKGCPPEGDGGDPVLNRLKNRVDEGDYVAAQFDVIFNLKWPASVEHKNHNQWSSEDTAMVERFEGIPVAVEGYLSKSKEEGPESCNCHGADHEFRDFHMWLTKTPDEDRSQSIVVEVTPRIRVNRPNWTTLELGKIARNNERIRVSGWLMLDPEHPEQLGK